MDTLKMVAEIKSERAKLEAKKASLLNRVAEIDEKLSYYSMAIDSLAQTINQEGTADPATVKKSKPAIMYEYNGVKQSLADWSKQSGINIKTLWYRLNKGWTLEKAISEPARNFGKHVKQAKKAKPSKVFAYDCHDNVLRQYVGVCEASRALNLPVSVI